MDILTPIMIVSAIGLLAGVILAVASIVMRRLSPKGRLSPVCVPPAAPMWLKNAPSFWAPERWK